MGRCRHNDYGRLSIALSAGLLTAALTGCSISQALRPEYYTVQRGDTLYSIAQTYGIDDWHDLAHWNQIGPPYRIDVGERLTLDPYPSLDYNQMPIQRDAQGRRIVRAPQDTQAAQRRSIQASTPQLTRTIETSDQSALPNTGPHRPAKAAPPGPRTVATGHANKAHGQTANKALAASPAPRSTAPGGGPSEDGWQWPASGSILRGYDPDKNRQGIEIGGQRGAPVYAASSGKVFYVGSGLKGYGKLIIIKHDPHYLSAYGFNRRTLVKQGQNVAAGAHIAAMGLGPGNVPMLHFEIRHDGDPIDPESVLPEH